MKQTFFISDTHLNHDSDWIVRRRNFMHVDLMTQLIVQRWNEVVHDEDDVYVIGDIARGDADIVQRIVSSLKGNIYVILGNHDGTSCVEGLQRCKNVKWIMDYTTLVTIPNRKPILLQHKPPIQYDTGRYPQCIHGHLHEASSRLTNNSPDLINVNCDLNNYYPIEWNQLMQIVVNNPPPGYTTEYMREHWDYFC